MSDETTAGPLITDWLSAVGTIGATIIALGAIFANRVRAWWYQPVLSLKVDWKTPYIIHEEDYDRSKNIMWHVFHIRGSVNNSGGASAKDVVVMAAKFEHVSEHGRLTPVAGFVPLPLNWSYRDAASGEQSKLRFLPKGTPTFFDLLRMDVIYSPFESGKEQSSTPPQNVQSTAYLTLVPLPAQKFHWLVEGTYRLTLHLTAEGCDVKESVIQLNYLGGKGRSLEEFGKHGVYALRV